MKKADKFKSLNDLNDVEMQSSVRKVSIDSSGNIIGPKGLARVLSQHFQDPLAAEIAAERSLHLSNITLDGDNVTAAVPATFSSSTSRLNPENKFSSRLREDMRLSPIPLSPISSNKRKRESEDSKMSDCTPTAQVKRLYARGRGSPSPSGLVLSSLKSAMSEGSEASTQTHNTATSISPMLVDSPTLKSPKVTPWAAPGVPLNLSAAGNDMANMKLS